MGDREARVAAVALLAALVLGGCTSPASSDPTGPSSPSPGASVLGRADLEELRPWSAPSTWATGVWRTASDLSDLVNAYPDSEQRFAGVWIAKDGQSIGVGVVDRTYAATTAELAAWVAQHHPGVDVRPVRVTRSQADLRALQQAVYAFAYPGVDAASPDVDAVGLVGTGMLVQTDRVMVSLLPGHHDLAERIAAEFGDQVVVVEDAAIGVAAGAAATPSPT